MMMIMVILHSILMVKEATVKMTVALKMIVKMKAVIVTGYSEEIMKMSY